MDNDRVGQARRCFGLQRAVLVVLRLGEVPSACDDERVERLHAERSEACALRGRVEPPGFRQVALSLPNERSPLLVERTDLITYAS